MKGLTFRNTIGMRYQAVRNEQFYGDESIMGKRTSINGSLTNTENGSFQTSNVLSYSTQFYKSITSLLCWDKNT